MTEKNAIEEGQDFTPKFDRFGLIPAIAQDAETGRVLMMAYMSAESLHETIKTGNAVYFSRTRQRLWRKGEQSGHFQKVKQILVDCDQDCILLKVTVDAGQCHVGYDSCFYREINKADSSRLNLIAEKSYNPEDTYK